MASRATISRSAPPPIPASTSRSAGPHFTAGNLVDVLNPEDRLLLIDDVFDSGRSIRALLKELKQRCRNNMPDEVKVATVYYKPSRNVTDLTPDFFVHETNDWLIFPHEINGLTEDEIRAHKHGGRHSCADDRSAGRARTDRALKPQCSLAIDSPSSFARALTDSSLRVSALAMAFSAMPFLASVWSFWISSWRQGWRCLSKRSAMAPYSALAAPGHGGAPHDGSLTNAS